MAHERVLVRFTRRHNVYAAGEVAGFTTEGARDLFVRLVAEPVDGDWRGVNVPRKGVTPTEAAHAGDSGASGGEAVSAPAEPETGAGAAPDAAQDAEPGVGPTIAQVVAGTVAEINGWIAREGVGVDDLRALYEAEMLKSQPRRGVLENIDAAIAARGGAGGGDA
jgi:hypothetical protein